MNTLNKIVVLGLLLHLLVLNSLFYMQDSCHRQRTTNQMDCCGSMNTPIERTESYPIFQTCTCEITENSQTKTTLTYLVEFSKPNSKRIVEDSVSDSPRLSSIVDSPIPLQRFNNNTNPSFSLKLKIYDLVSSYLI